MLKQLEPVADSFIMNYEKHHQHPRKFSSDGSVCCTIKSKRRETHLTKYQHIVQKHIGKCFGKCPRNQKLALIGANQQGIPHLVDVKKGQAPYSYFQKLYCLMKPLLIL